MVVKGPVGKKPLASATRAGWAWCVPECHTSENLHTKVPKMLLENAARSFPINNVLRIHWHGGSLSIIYIRRGFYFFFFSY